MPEKEFYNGLLVKILNLYKAYENTKHNTQKSLCVFLEYDSFRFLSYRIVKVSLYSNSIGKSDKNIYNESVDNKLHRTI